MSNENASPDVHELTPDHPLRVDRTGLEGLYLKVNLIFRKSCEELPAELSLYIDLPPEKRGVHLSRLVKAALTEVETGCTDLSALLSRIAQKALNTHSYSEIAEVVLNSSLPLRGQKVDLNFRVKRRRNGKESWFMEVKIEGAISCPCAKEVISEYDHKFIIPSRHLIDIELKGPFKTELKPIPYPHATTEYIALSILNELRRKIEGKIQLRLYEGRDSFAEVSSDEQ